MFSEGKTTCPHRNSSAYTKNFYWRAGVTSLYLAIGQTVSSFFQNYLHKYILWELLVNGTENELESKLGKPGSKFLVAPIKLIYM
jgi:hypothetical protein